MNPLSQRTIVLNTNGHKPCYLLEKLPLELREQIYTYFLGAKYTKFQHNVRSYEVCIHDLPFINLAFTNFSIVLLSTAGFSGRS